MRFVIQRVTHASVTIKSKIVGKIEKGFLVLIGIENDDTEKIADKMVSKMTGLRIFEDENGKMNLSLIVCMNISLKNVKNRLYRWNREFLVLT